MERRRDIARQEIIMSTFVVIVFPDEKSSYDGLRAVDALHDEGTITLYSSAIIQRNADGPVWVKEQHGEGPIATCLCTLAGGLIGLFAGPVGWAVGMGAGTVLGALRDLFNLGVSNEFLDAVCKALTPGKVALAAEISEENVAPLNSRMASLGGIVIRELRDDFIDDEIGKRISRAKSELAQRRGEHAAARAEHIEALKQEVTKADQRLRAAADDASVRIKRYREETEAKVRTLQDQAKKASSEARAWIDKRIAEMYADGQLRIDKLEQAWKLTQEALKP